MSERLPAPEAKPDRRPAGRAARLPLREWPIPAYRFSDDLSGALILAMLVFSPWALGTTQPWAIRCMNVVECTLGLLLLFKLFLRQAGVGHAPRWDHFSPRSGEFSRHQPGSVRQLKNILAALTVGVLAECLLSAWNAAAVYTPETRVFHYQHHFEWLPHSFDRDRSWASFWKYLGLAAAFWSVNDWLAGLNPGEERSPTGPDRRAAWVPARLRILLWVLTINGTVLGVEAILQRVAGSNKLLFLVPTHNSTDFLTQFGPYAYRANAAQYFNLLWPLCLGFWWCLQRHAARRTQAHLWLLPCAAVMAACPMISITRGGALVSAAMLVLIAAYYVLTREKSPDQPGVGEPSGRVRPLRKTAPEPWAAAAGEKPALPGRPDPAHSTEPGPAASVPMERPSPTRLGRHPSALLMVLFVTVTLGLGGCFGWHSLAPRMEQIAWGYAGRAAMHDSAEPMVRDYPVFGTGPGTFATVFQLYRYSNDVYWSEQVYDDWLETRITLGWLGLGLLLAALALTALRGFLPGGMRGLRPLVFFAWLALGGCLLHARFDIPFQIHSILLLFLVICAILLNLGRAAGHSRG